MKQRDEQDPVQNHYLPTAAQKSDQKPPTQNNKPSKEVSKSPIKDEVSNNSRKSYGNLKSQDGVS